MWFLVLFQFRFSNSELIQFKTSSGLTLIHVGSLDIFKEKQLCAKGRKLQAGQKRYSILLCPGQPELSPPASQGIKKLENFIGNDKT